MKHISFLLFLILSLHDAYAEPVLINGLYYELDEATHEAMLANENSWTGDLTIPSAVQYGDETYAVTSIEWWAFNRCETLTHVTIPATIQEIRHYFGYEACKNPFSGCTNLKSIEVDEDNEWMCSIDGVLFNKEKTWLYAYPAGAERTSYHILDGVTTIGGDAFAYNLALRSVVMPNSVEKTFFGTFKGCRNLENVRFSENLKSLAAGSFDNCGNIRVIDLPASVSSFAESVFRWTNIDALVVRGTFSKELRSDTFYSVSKSMIIYAQPSEISKFKKVFSGTVLPLEDYVDGISAPSIVNCNLSNCKWYDLSGRQIRHSSLDTRHLPHGIYIREGKKVVVK